jgi:hypothetical protein
VGWIETRPDQGAQRPAAAQRTDFSGNLRRQLPPALQDGSGGECSLGRERQQAPNLVVNRATTRALLAPPLLRRRVGSSSGGVLGILGLLRALVEQRGHHDEEPDDEEGREQHSQPKPSER